MSSKLFSPYMEGLLGRTMVEEIETDKVITGDDLIEGYVIHDEPDDSTSPDTVSIPTEGIQVTSPEFLNMYPSASIDNVKKSEPTPYCPIYITKTNDGTSYITAYITDRIEDVDKYIDLIDILFMAKEHDQVIIYLDSPGGCVSSGSIISSAIHHSRAHVKVIARGICASAGALIHSSCPDADVTDFAVMMYHMSSHFDAGVSTRIADRAANQVKYVNECLLNTAIERHHITPEELAKIQAGEEIFITAEEFRQRVHGVQPTSSQVQEDVGQE